MSPVATAAASEGYRCLSLTPTQPPIGDSYGRLDIANESHPKNNSQEDATLRATTSIPPSVHGSARIAMMTTTQVYSGVAVVPESMNPQ